MKEAFKHALAHGRGLRLGKTITLGLILGSAVMPGRCGECRTNVSNGELDK